MWEERVRNEVAAAGREPRPILINTLPAVLDQLAEALAADHPRRTATQGSTLAHEHGGERVRLTHFALEDLIAEYKILRQVLLAVLDEDEPLSPEDRNTLHLSLDQAIAEACSGYVLVQSTFRDQFFATVAHDLRNPLNAALGTAALLVSRSPSSEIMSWGQRIVENIGRVDRMVQDLLNAMRVQAGARLQLDIEACDLVELVRLTLERFATEHGGRLVFIAPEPVRGFMAPEALQRAVENLTDNALKYGAPERPITVTVQKTHGRAIVRVHNDGPPIPADEQETLFRAFQRLTDAASSGKMGWGLGLAQVRAVAEAHGGSIGVDSVPDRGTTFTIDIPLDARPYQSNPITPTPVTHPVE
jgi:signal transduction histidine kinase